MADFTALKTTIQTYIKQNGNEEITGDILQEVLLAMVETMGDSAINDLVTDLSGEVTARQNADTTLGNSIQAIHDAIDNGYVYAGIATPTGTPVSGKVFYFAVTAGTYTNFGGLTVTQGINILKYNGSAWSVVQVVGIDDDLKPGSHNLVKNNNIAIQLNEGKALTEMYLGKGHLSSSGHWGNIDDSFHAVFPIKNGDVIKVRRSTQSCIIGILKEYSTPVLGNSIEYATGESRRVISSTDLTTITVASSDAKYLVVVVEITGSTGYVPSEMTVNGYDVKKSIQQHIADIMESPFVVGSDDYVLQHPQFSISGFFYASLPSTFVSNAGYDISDYFAVEAGDEIVLNTVVPTLVCAILLYNRNKDLIGYTSGTTDSFVVSTFDVLISDYPTAKYVRVCGRHGYTHNAVVKKPAMSPSDMEDNFREDITKASEADVLSKQKSCSLASAKNFMGHSVTNLPSRKYQLFICYGQSLSDGSDSLYVEDPVVEGAYMVGTIIGSGTELTPLQLGAGTRQHPIVSCVNSLTTLFKKYNNKYFDFVAASYGAGGKSIAQLSKASRIQQYAQDYDYAIKGAGQYENVFLAGLDNAITACGNGNVECPAIIFLQGERDYVTDSQAPDPMPGSVDAAYACGGDGAMYKSRMMDLKNDMQEDIMKKLGQSYKPIFCIYEVSGSFIKNDQMTINMAQIEFAQENDDVFLMPSAYFVPDYGAHLSTNGYRWYGEFLAKALFGIVYQNIYWKPILPYQYIVENDKVIISLENYVGKMHLDDELVELSENYGFAVFINDVYNSSNISNVSINDNHIVLTCNQSLTDKKVEVVYGGDKTNGSGNVRDTDVYQALYTYWDDSNDKGSDNQKTIGYRPEEDGHVIIGKKYPMYNWLASFYKLVQDL